VEVVVEAVVEERSSARAGLSLVPKLSVLVPLGSSGAGDEVTQSCSWEWVSDGGANGGEGETTERGASNSEARTSTHVLAEKENINVSQ
jgi:hypothetical protein